MGNLTSWLKMALRRMDEAGLFGRFAGTIVALSLITRLGVLLCFWPTWVWHTGHVQDSWNELAINWVKHGYFWLSGGRANHSTRPGLPALGDSSLPAVWRKLCRVEHRATSPRYRYLPPDCPSRTATVGQQNSLASWCVLQCLSTDYLLYGHDTTIHECSAIGLPLVLPVLRLGPGLREEVDSVGSGTRIGCAYAEQNRVSSGRAWFISYIVWLKRKEPPVKATVRQVSIVLLTAVLVVAPWTYRNYVVTKGAFVPVQAMFWELVWQKYVISDLDATEGEYRSDGRTLDYILARRAELFDRVKDPTVVKLNGPKKELYDERVFRDQVVGWVKTKPTRFLGNVTSNIWGFWVRAENLKKTLLMVSMQAVFLGAALLGLWLTIRYGQVRRIRFGLLLILTLWAEHSLVLGWGRFSLDTVPVLAIFFGTGIDQWMKQNAVGNQVTRS